MIHLHFLWLLAFLIMGLVIGLFVGYLMNDRIKKQEKIIIKHLLISKIPNFNMDWSKETKDAWFECLNKIRK